MKPTKIQDAIAAISLLVTRGNMIVRVKFGDTTHTAMLSKTEDAMGLMTKCGESAIHKDIIEPALASADAIVTCMLCISLEE